MSAVGDINSIREIHLLVTVDDTKERQEVQQAADPKAKKKDKEKKKEAKGDSSIGFLQTGSKSEIPLSRRFEYWKEDDDSDGEEEKEMRGPLEKINHLAFASSVGAMVGSSLFFYKDADNTLPVGLAGGVIDISKTYYTYVQRTPNNKTFARSAAAALFIATVILNYGFNEEEKQGLAYKVANSIPWIYPALGVLKVEIKNLKLDETIRGLFQKNGITLTKLQANLISSMVQGLPAYAFTVAKLDPILNAACGIFYKVQMRRVMDEVGKSIANLENRTTQRIAIAGMVFSLLASGTLNISAISQNWLTPSQISFLTPLLILPAFDTFSRLVKENVKIQVKADKKKQKDANAEVAKTPMEKMEDGAIQLGKFTGFASIVLGSVGLTTQGDLPSKSAGVAAAILQDCVSFLKVATKNVALEVVLPTAALILTGAGATYVAHNYSEEKEEPFSYRYMIALGSVAATFAVYHGKRMVRPQKLKLLETA